MQNPYPKLKVTVKTYDPANLVSSLPPDSNLENIIGQLESAVVWIPTWPYPLKHGDSFTVYGQQAIYLHNLIPQLNENNNTLIKVDYYGDVIEAMSLSGTALLVNTDYVDYRPGQDGAEASNLEALLQSLGRDYVTFTDVSASGVEAILDKKTILLPELEESTLVFDGDSRQKIENWVSNGGNLVVFYPSDDYLTELNTIFGFSVSGGDSDNSTKTVEAAGTVFASCSATLPSLSATRGVDMASLPSGAVVVYKTDGYDSSVVTDIPYENGHIYILSWDWYDAAPVGTEDGGWLQLVEKITE